MVGFKTDNFYLADKLRSALALAEAESGAKEIINKRLLSITSVDRQTDAGVVINNFEGCPIVGEYRIFHDRAEKLTKEELAMRIHAVAVILEIEYDIKARPVGQWLLGEEEVERNGAKYISAFAEISSERSSAIM